MDALMTTPSKAALGLSAWVSFDTSMTFGFRRALYPKLRDVMEVYISKHVLATTLSYNDTFL